MSKIRVMINGIQYELDEAGTILDECLRLHIDIPTLCAHPAVSNSGVCGLCAVEIQGMNDFQAACMTQIKDGMVIQTRSQQLHEARKKKLETMMRNHPNDCMTCDANGRCKLQDLAYLYQIEPDVIGVHLRDMPIDNSSLFLYRDLNKCIQCELCMRVCDEIQNSSIYSMACVDGELLPMPTPHNKLADSSCVSCGQCATICPTAAIIEKPSKGKTRWSDVKKTKTTCNYCGVGCQLDLYTDLQSREILRVDASMENSEVNDGIATCVKGKFGFGFVNHPDRLTDPLIRKGDRFVKASWEEALDYAAHGILKSVHDHGPNSVGLFASARCTNEDNYLFQKMARAAIGTNNVDHCARLCHSSTVAGLAPTFGNGAMTNNLQDIMEAKLIFLIGANPAENHPVYASRIRKAVRFKGTQLIVADPRKTELVRDAVLWLNLKPGTDGALLNGMLRVIVEKGWIDRDFIAERTLGWKALQEYLQPFSLEFVSKTTSLPMESIVQAARLYATSERSAIVYAMGITQHICGTDHVIALSNLALATGHVGKPGTGLNPLRGQNNVQGACDLGCLPNVFPGYQKVADESTRLFFQRLWKVDHLPQEDGLTITQMIGNKKIRSLIIMGENPAVSDANSLHVEQFLDQLDFHVNLDLFMNETNRFADVIFPAASAYEKDGSFTNTERRVQRVRKVIHSPGRANGDHWIIQEFSKRMGYSMDYSDVSKIWEEIRQCTPIYAGIAYSRIDMKGVQWPCLSEEVEGTPYLYHSRFSHPDGKARFVGVKYTAPVELPDSEYPFVLSTGRVLFQYHTGTMTRRIPEIHQSLPTVEIELHPDDAAQIAVKTGDRIRLTSRRGNIEGPAKVTDRSSRGLVFVPFHYAEARANVLTSNENLDPVAGIPSFKVSAVRVEKVCCEPPLPVK